MEWILCLLWRLLFGIAIQNFPEGMAISLPMKSEGASKFRSFLLGTLSGIVEPIAAIITILISSVINSILPFLLAFAARCDVLCNYL